ncbi:MAG: Ankyrin repeat (many copies) [Rickettsiaceae bacterium]|jgi:ankyrin repeat protein|nr:Ankyrin repeat (many copies) [Rickettsiaceae bacterium]
MPSKKINLSPLYPHVKYKNHNNFVIHINIQLIKCISNDSEDSLQELDKLISNHNINISNTNYSFEGYRIDRSNNGEKICYKFKNLTLLHIACLTASPNTIKYLLQKGANVNTPDSQGNLPISYSILPECEEKIAVIKILLSSKNNLNCENIFKESPLKVLYNHLSDISYPPLERLKLAKILIEKKISMPNLYGIIKEIKEEQSIYNNEIQSQYEECLKLFKDFLIELNISQNHNTDDFIQTNQSLQNCTIEDLIDKLNARVLSEEDASCYTPVEFCKEYYDSLGKDSEYWNYSCVIL